MDKLTDSMGLSDTVADSDVEFDGCIARFEFARSRVDRDSLWRAHRIR